MNIYVGLFILWNTFSWCLLECHVFDGKHGNVSDPKEHSNEQYKVQVQAIQN